MKKIVFFYLSIFIFSCSSTKEVTSTDLKSHETFELVGISEDKTYGLTPKNPIQVGGVDKNRGPSNERRYLNALAGPNGEAISYHRAGSCCAIKSKNDPFGFGSVLLDNYRVTWEGSKDTVSIYINMYDYGQLKAPTGFTIKE